MSGDRHTLGSLGLDLEAARNGKTWLLLPQGFRDQGSGSTYPLPSRRHELQVLAAITIPTHKTDSGCVYLRRALKEWKGRQAKRNSATLDLAFRDQQITEHQHNYLTRIKQLKAEAGKAVDEVREEAQQAIASMNDLFSLSRKGIDGQMRAHLDGKEWQGEKISAKAFRECFRMVTQAVKGLGLPSGERPKAAQAILEEVAASLKDTQETVALAPGTDDEPEIEH